MEAADFYYKLGHSRPSIKLLDPFGGDGRLVEWLIEAWCKAGFPDMRWDVAIWDIDEVGFDIAKSRFKHLSQTYGVKCRVDFKTVDTFSHICITKARFDIVITNPPWEVLKPDRRELESLSSTRKVQYVSRLRAYDRWLGGNYPLSQPRKSLQVGEPISLVLA